MSVLFCDTETFSKVPITYGTHAYAEQAEVMLFAWALDGGKVNVVDLTQPEEKEWFLGNSSLMALIEDADEIIFHNQQFDRTVLRHALGIDLPIERIHCTMTRALMHGLPGGLDKLCEIFKLPTDLAKDKEGRKFINLFCKPTKDGGRNTRETHPEHWQGFIEYAKRDIEAMRVLYRRLPRWNYVGKELALWHLDQRINDRGFAVDCDLARGAIAAVGDQQSKLARRTQHLTDGAVDSATRRDAMLKHIAKYYGISLPDMQKDTLERRINDPELPIELRELFGVRLQSTTTSTSKYKTLINGVSSDGRLRGTLQFCGANRTGRWAGRLFQPQNLPRPALPQGDIEFGIRALKAGCADLMFNNVMEVASAAIRGCIVAPTGRKLVVADLANIEGRAAAWLAGESWKLDAFRLYDTFVLDKSGQKIPVDKKGNIVPFGEHDDFLRVGPDLYKVAYARAFGVQTSEVDKDQRQIGKVMELMLQYQGGVGAFITGAATYGIDLDAMAETAWPSIPIRVKEEARKWLLADSNTQGDYGLSERTFIVCDSLKRMWREAQPAIASSWGEIQNCVKHVIARPGMNMRFRKIQFRRDGAWLRIILPSGRSLCYASPKIEDDGRITYLGVNQYSRKWTRINTYGGKLLENITQAVARDVMTDSMADIDEFGYEIILTVHDELITEAPDLDVFTAEHLSSMMATNPEWADGLPLAASGFEAYRYKKE